LRIVYLLSASEFNFCKSAQFGTSRIYFRKT